MRTQVTFALVVLSHLAAAHRFGQRLLLTPPESQHVLKNTGSGRQPGIPTSHPLRPPSWHTTSIGHHGAHSGGFVAFGDSYSAGIGTGVVDGDENECRRGIHAYAELIADDLQPTSFQFLSCTGAVTTDILVGSGVSQIDRFNASLPADFALLSIGGNDLGFFDVINACIFRFYTFYSGGCEEALAHSRALLESDEFENHMQAVITEILDKARRKEAKKKEEKPPVTVTVTGYARFFNELTDACDDVSFGVWWDGWDGPRLTKALRSEMNSLVLAVNAKLRKTIEAINANVDNAAFARDKEEEVVFFVDYDRAFDGHRFCEPNVTEPDHERANTWFFFVGGPDTGKNGTQPQRDTDVKTLPSGSPSADPSSCLGPARKSGDWGMLALCYMVMAKQHDPALRPARGDIMASSSTWYVPTYYGKTFHPRSRGHEAIRDKIYETWSTSR